MKDLHHYRDIESVNWVPQATLDVPIEYLEEKNGIHFVEGRDDLDSFVRTGVLEVNGQEFLLFRHRGLPSNRLEIWLPSEISDTREITRLVGAIMQKLQVPPNALSWQRGLS
jgi:hypothetical protein